MAQIARHRERHGHAHCAVAGILEAKLVYRRFQSADDLSAVAAAAMSRQGNGDIFAHAEIEQLFQVVLQVPDVLDLRADSEVVQTIGLDEEAPIDRLVSLKILWSPRKPHTHCSYLTLDESPSAAP